MTMSFVHELSSPHCAAHVGSKRTAPEHLSDVRVRDYAETRPFTKLGEWGDTISVARPGTGVRLVRWLSLNRMPTEARDVAWERCRQANPHCFAQYQIVRLARRSFFLPRGEVVFEVTEDPTQIPENPPAGVTMRHLEATNMFPHSTSFFLQPVFTIEPYFRLYTAEDLREDAAADRDECLFAARLYGWAFRSAAWSRNRMFDAAKMALRGGARAIDRLGSLLEPSAPVWPGRSQFGSRDALLRRIPEGDLARDPHRGLDDDMQLLQHSVAELRWRLRVDPITCFSLPDEPKVLWFEAHWFEGADGRTYVHY